MLKIKEVIVACYDTNLVPRFPSTVCIDGHIMTVG